MKDILYVCVCVCVCVSRDKDANCGFVQGIINSLVQQMVTKNFDNSRMHGTNVKNEFSCN